MSFEILKPLIKDIPITAGGKYMLVVDDTGNIEKIGPGTCGDFIRFENGNFKKSPVTTLYNSISISLPSVQVGDEFQSPQSDFNSSASTITDSYTNPYNCPVYVELTITYSISHRGQSAADTPNVVPGTPWIVMNDYFAVGVPVTISGTLYNPLTTTGSILLNNSSGSYNYLWQNCNSGGNTSAFATNDLEIRLQLNPGQSYTYRPTVRFVSEIANGVRKTYLVTQRVGCLVKRKIYKI